MKWILTEKLCNKNEESGEQRNFKKKSKEKTHKTQLGFLTRKFHSRFPFKSSKLPKPTPSLPPFIAITNSFTGALMRPLSLKGHDRALTRVRLNREGDLLFSSSKGKSVCVWFTENGERLGTYDGHNGAIWDVDVSWDSSHLVSSAADNTMKVGFHLLVYFWHFVILVF